MKKIVLSVAIICSSMIYAQNYSAPMASTKQEIEQQFSISKIEVEYSRPNVKGRKIFGDLVKYGEVWRFGANAATKIRFGQDVLIAGKPLKRGAYAIFAVPNEASWKIIFNKAADAWGAYTYDAKDDVLSIDVPVEKTAKKTETFTIGFDDVSDEKITLSAAWDDVKIAFPIETANKEEVSKISKHFQEIRKIDWEIRQKK